MEFLIILFGVLTLLSLPSLYYYTTFRTSTNSIAGMFDKFSMANLGYSSALWNSVHLEISKLTLNCETGQMAELVSFGIIPAKSKVQDACFENEETAVWNNILQTDLLRAYIEQEWIGNKNWSLHFGQFINKDMNSQQKCLEDNSRFYTQVLWKIGSEGKMKERKFIQRIFVWTIIASALIYFISIEWYDHYAEQNFENYDKSTTTSSDYTVEFKIPEGIYKNFKENVYPFINEKRSSNKVEQLPWILIFKEYLTSIIENALEQKESPEKFDVENNEEQLFNDIIKNKEKIWENLLKSSSFGGPRASSTVSANREFGALPQNEYQIADVNFVFRNRELLDLLNERGQALEEKNHWKQSVKERKIEKLVKEKHEKLTTPLAIFITFETEYGYLRASQMASIKFEISDTLFSRNWSKTQF